MHIINVVKEEASMVIKKWRTSKAYRFAAVAAIAVGSALIVSACNQSPTATDSVGNETAVLGQTFATKPAPKAAKAPKVDVCHLDDEGGYHLINVSGNALSAHIAHGDGQPGDGTFDEACGLVVAPPTTVFVLGEATGTMVTLSWGPGTEISVVEAVYGGNCVGRGFSPDTNYPLNVDETAHLAAACDGLASCNYTVDHTVIGDAYLGCPKDYAAVWACE